MNELYNIVGVPPKATKEQIRRAFRTRSKQLHPDAGGNVEQFRQLTYAYSVLNDDEQRQWYDKHGVAKRTAPRGAALELIYALLNAIVDNESVGTSADMLNLIRTNLETLQNKIKTEITVLERQIAKIERMTGKFKLRHESNENLIGAMLAQRRSNTAKRMTEAQNRHQTVLDALAIVEQYSFEPDGTEWIGIRLQNVGATTRITPYITTI